MAFEEDYDLNDVTCPNCGHGTIHSRRCQNIHCEGGSIDDNDDDPINFMPGESYVPCDDCKGTGTEVWCPKCGKDLSGHKLDWGEDDMY